MFGIDGEVLGKVLGGAAAAFIIGLLTWIGNRLNRKDAAEKPPQPAAMGIVLDGDTAQALLNEMKEMHADMVKWRVQDREQEKDDKIERLEAQLARASGKTHANQASMVERVNETDRKIDNLMEALSQPDLVEALKNLKMH